MVVAEIGEFWQEKDGLIIRVLNITIANLDSALADEVHLFDVGLVGDDDLTCGIDSTIELYNQLICKTSFTLFKKVTKIILKVLENLNVLN